MGEGEFCGDWGDEASLWPCLWICAVSDIVSTRTYDLSVTYDTYFQTPRLWLFGYDEVCV